MTTPGPRNPLPAERHARLLELLERDGIVRVTDLVTDLAVTPVTVRRDIVRLEEEGRLRRVHGGAVATSGTAAPEAVEEPPRIGVLVPSLAYYWPGVVQTLEAEARARGLRTFLRASTYDAADERPILDRLATQDRVDGLVLAPRTDGPGTQALVRWLEDSDIPTVLIEREATTTAGHGIFNSVMSDHALGTVKAVHHLAELGHRKVGVVLSRHSPTSRKMAAGWRTACAELGLTSDERFERLVSIRSTAEFAPLVNDLVESVLASGTTGLLVLSDPEAFAVVQNLLERGYDVPGDLSVIAYDDVMADSLSPRLTAVRPPTSHVARVALDRLQQLMADPSTPAQRTLISPELKVRESSGPAPGRG